jgi:hypothetical protein
LLLSGQSQTLALHVKSGAPISAVWTFKSIYIIQDEDTIHQSQAALKIHGSSSSNYLKKNYKLEFQDQEGSPINVAIGNMPADDDYILHGPYSDKTLMRNALAYYFARKIEPWAPRTQFAELWLDEKYKGVYLIVEKIKIHKDRVDIENGSKGEPNNNRGFIISLDRVEEQDHGWWSAYDNDPHWFELKDPDEDEISFSQREYLKNYLKKFEDVLSGFEYAEPNIGYRRWADEQSFINHLILREFANDVDAYQLSTYMHKDAGGKLMMGPLWDNNLSFGNLNHCFSNLSTEYWAFNSDQHCDAKHPFWWDQLLSDTLFLNNWNCTWSNLRNNILSDESINHVIDSLKLELAEISANNFEQWPVLQVNIPPNPTTYGSWDEAVEWMRSWILDRTNWIDNNIPGTCRTYPTPDFTQIISYPNPFKNYIQFAGFPERGGTLSIFDLNGDLKRRINIEDKQFSYLIDNINDFPASISWQFIGLSGLTQQGILLKFE